MFMHEHTATSNGELIEHVTHSVREAFDHDPELVKILTASKADHDGVIKEIFSNKPSQDTDKNGWLFLLGSSYLGYAIHQKLVHGKEVFEGDFADALKSQLAEDYLRWGDTWKKRPIEGQLGRIYDRFRDYKDQYENAGQEFPWLKVAGETIISLYRIDHPEYQK